MGWIGLNHELHATLRAHVDRDEQGRFLVRGNGGPFYFLGT